MVEGHEKNGCHTEGGKTIIIDDTGTRWRGRSGPTIVAGTSTTKKFLFYSLVWELVGPKLPLLLVPLSSNNNREKK